MADPAMPIVSASAGPKRGRFKRLFVASWPSLASVALALLICLVAIAITKGSLSVALDAYVQMLWGGIGDLPRLLDGGGLEAVLRPLGESADKAAMLTLTGLSVAVAFQAGLFNIGAQGQLAVGGIAAAAVGAAPGIPDSLRLVLCLLVAAIAGGLYGFIPGWLRVRRGVHEVISTIMLNWVSRSLVDGWLVVGPLAAKSPAGESRAGTADIARSAHLPRLLGDLSRLNLGFLIALALAVACWAWLYRSVHGFETRAVGLGPEAARASGIDADGRVLQAMVLSGALAGLAGAVMVCGTEFKFPPILGAEYGFDGIAIALIGVSHPIGVAASALFFGTLRAGGTRMQLLGVHKSFPELIQALALLLVAGRLLWERMRRRLARSAPEVAP